MDLMDYRRKIIANSPHLKSTSGAVATFSDGADLPLKSLLVDIEPVQSGTGDPSPSNIRPISGWNGVKVTRSGESALKPSTAFAETKNGLTFTSDGNGVYHIKGKSTSSSAVQSTIFQVPEFVIPLSQTHSLYLNNNQADSGIAMRFMNGSTVIDSWTFGTVNRISTQYAAMGGKTCNGIQINVTTSAQPVDMTFIPMLIAKADIGTYNISFSDADTVYGGTINPLTGVLTVDRAIVDLGTLDWRMSGSGNTAFHYANTSALGVATNISTTLNYICSNYSIVAVSSGGTATGMAFTSANQLRIRDATYASASDFKTAMDGVTLCYEVANPTEIQLTPQQVRTLYGSNTIFADTGNVALEYWAHA